jgi:hypothetical protein
VGANLVPLVGVLALGWGLHSLLVVYWLESGVVGIESVAKILIAQGEKDNREGGRGDAASDGDEGTGGPGSAVAGRGEGSVTLRGVSLDSLVGLGNLLVAGFFTVHYGIFWVVHGSFVLSFPILFDDLAPASPTVVATAFVGLAAYHALSFLANYIGKAEYLGASPGALASEPYRRVFVLHFTVLGGAVVLTFLGAPLGALAAMVLVKTVLDLRAHWQEHERARKRTSTTPAAE